MFIGKPKIIIYLALVCILLGLALYLLFRPTTLLIFRWLDLVGLTDSIKAMRSLVDGYGRYLPNWVIFSLPFSLWILAYLFFIGYIWIGSESIARHVWFWCIPVVAILAELAQARHIILGYFDVRDLLALIIVIIIGFIVNYYMQSIKGVKNYD